MITLEFRLMKLILLKGQLRDNTQVFVTSVICFPNMHYSYPATPLKQGIVFLASIRVTVRP